LHPVRERSLRALDLHMPEAIGFDSQKEVIDFALEEVPACGHYLEFGVFSGGTIRYIARRKRAAVSEPDAPADLEFLHGLVNLVTGNRLHYYNGLAVHLGHNVMRWHPNTRGFGFQADILSC
jgi:hypothetical protein